MKKKKNSRAKRKLAKQKNIRQKNKQLKPAFDLLTQVEIDNLFSNAKEVLAEVKAKKRLRAENQAFDEFVETGKVVPPKEDLERFFTNQRVGNQLPDIDFDEPNGDEIVNYLKHTKTTIKPDLDCKTTRIGHQTVRKISTNRTSPNPNRKTLK